MAGQDIRQLLLQVDASVALAQRNLNSLANTVDRDTKRMEEGLQRPEDALAGLSRAFASMDQVVVASMNQQRAFGMVVDQVTAQEMRAAQAVGNLARSMSQLSTPVQIATRQQLEAAAAIGGFAQAAGRMDPAMRRMGNSFGNAGMRSVQASQQFQDFFIQVGSGQSVLVAASQQLSQLGFVMQGSKGAAGKFADFISGPWGAAIFLATAAIGIFVNSMSDAEEETNDLTDAKNLHKLSSEELTKAIRDEIDAAESAIRTSRETEQRALDAAKAKRQETLDRRRNILAMLEEARLAEEQALQGPGGDPAQAAAAVGRVADLQSRLAEAQEAVRESQRLVNIREIPIAQRDIAAQLDAATAATDRYERALARLNERRRQSAINDADYRRELLQISQRRDRELEAAQAAERRARASRRPSTAPTGEALTLSEARRIAEGAGATVTSTTRTRAEQQRLYDRYRRGEGPLAAPPGRSAHESGRAIDMVGISLAQARAAFRGKIAPRQIIEEVNPRTGARHVHATLPRSPAAQEANAEEERLERARLERERNDLAFNQDLARANEELLRARHELTTNAEAQAAFQIEQLNLERARVESSIEGERIQGRYTTEQANALKLLNQQVTDQRIANVRTREASRIAEERTEILQGDLRLEGELVRLRGREAVTREERRAVELRLLDLSREQERLELEAIIASEQATNAQKQIARRRLSMLDTISNLERRGIERENEGPRARYFRELREGQANVGDQLEELEVRAMRDLDDATKSALQSTLGLHGALGDIIADLLMIMIRQQALIPLFERMSGGKGGGVLSGLLGGLLGGGGANNSVSKAKNASAWAAKTLFGGFRAGGGAVDAGKAYWVGERGKERFIPEVPGVIVPNNGAGGGGVVHVKLDYDRQVLRAEIIRTSGAVVAAEAPRIAAKGAGMALKELTRPRM